MKYFHSFEYRCVYDIKFTIMENNEEFASSTTIGYMTFKSQFYALNKKKSKLLCNMDLDFAK